MSKVAPGWWDYTTIDDEIVRDAASLSEVDIEQLARPGFEVSMFDTLEEFYAAEALEYIECWRRSTPDAPTGICGPIGPTEQLPLVARIVNDLQISIRSGHFWGMDEWVIDGKSVTREHPLSFARADLELCFNRIDPALRMPDENLHFLDIESIPDYARSYDDLDCLLMQGGQGEVKHWAFNDPFERQPPYADEPPIPAKESQNGNANGA